MGLQAFRQSQRRTANLRSTSGGGGGREYRDTGHIYTQSEVDEDTQRNITSAANLRRDFAGQLSAQRDAELARIEESGGSNPLKGVGSILEFLDRGRKTIQLGIRDYSGFDTRRDAEITAGDYWKVLKGDSEELVDTLGASVVGERGDLSTSNLLDGVWSSDEDDAWWDKALRGVVSFAGDVATDPFSYVTSGAAAVGKKAALSSMRQVTAKATRRGVEKIIREGFEEGLEEVAETAFERGIRKSIREALPEVYDKNLASEVSQLLKGQTLSKADLDGVFEKSVREAAGLFDDFADDIALKEAADLGAGVGGRKVNELAKHIEARDWDNLPTDYIDHVFTQRDGARLGESFTTGGIRLGLPFSATKTTRALPGTRGLSKKIPGMKTLRSWSHSVAGDKFKSFLPGINAEQPLFQAARRGAQEAGLGANEVMWAESITRAAKREVGSAQEQMATMQAARTLDTTMKSAGMDAETVAEVWRHVYPSIQVGRVSADIPKMRGVTDEVVQAVDEFVQQSHTTIGRAYDYLRRIDPSGVGHIENAIPLMFGNDFVRAMRRLEQGAFPFTIRAGEQGAEDVTRVAARLGVSEEELWLWIESWDSLTGFGRGAAKVGEGARVNKRRMGQTATSQRGTFAKESPDGGLVFFDSKAVKMQPEVGQADTLIDTKPTWMDQGQISDALGKVTRAIDKEYNLGLGLADDADALVRDPVKLVGDYISQMSALAEQRAFRRAAEFMGGIKQLEHGTNLESVLWQLGDATPTLTAQLKRIADTSDENIVEILSAEPKMVKVSMGGGKFIELPKDIAEHRRLQGPLKRLAKLNERMEGHKATIVRLRKREVRNLMDTKGLSRDQATAVVNATMGDAAKLRAELAAEVELAVGEIQEAQILAWFRAGRDGIEAERALAATREYADSLRAKARQAMQDAEDTYNAQFPISFDEEDEILTTLQSPFNYDDPVQFAEGIQAVFEPVTASMREQRDRQIKAIIEKMQELGEEREKLMDDLLDMSPEKNTRTQTPGPGMQQKRSRLELRIAAIEKRMSGLDSLGEYVEGARSADDIQQTLIAQEIARDIMNDATFELASAWGIRNVSDFADQRGDLIELGLARMAEKGDVAPRHLEQVRAAWNHFLDDVEAGVADMTDDVFNDPWFWNVLAHGYLADSDNVAAHTKALREAMIRGGADADEIDETLGLLGRAFEYEGFAAIEQKLSDEIDYVMRLADTAGESQASLLELGRLHAELPNRGAVLEDGVNWSLVSATPEKRMEMAFEIIEAKQARLAAAEARDETVLVDELITRAKAFYAGHAQNTTNKMLMASADEEFNGTAYALDRALSNLARAPYDPTAAHQAVKDQVLIQDAYQRLYPDRRITLRQTKEDGFRIVMRRAEPGRVNAAAPGAPVPPEPKVVLELLEQGKVSATQLRDNGLGYLADLHDVKLSLQEARRATARARYATKDGMARKIQALDDFDDLAAVLADVHAGTGSARKLREWVHTGTSTGRITKTETYSRLLRNLPAEDAGKLERSVQRALLLAEPPTAEAERLARLVDEDLWNDRFFRPMQETIEDITNLRDEIAAETEKVAVAEARQTRELANEFLDELMLLEALSRNPDLNGLAAAGNRTLETTKVADGRTAEQAVASVKKLARALEGKADGLSKAEVADFMKRLEGERIALPTEGFAKGETFGLGGQLADAQIDPVVGAIFRNMIAAEQAMFTPVGMSEMRKAAREVLRWWRGAATVARVPFHMRNAISAVANGMLISVGPQHYADVTAPYLAYRKALREGLDWKEVVDPKSHRMIEAALHQEVIGSGFVRSELNVALGGGSAAAKLKPWDADNFALFGAGAGMMQSLEDYVRLAAFHRWFDDAVPETASFARQMVMVAHFDYQHLGELEQKVKPIAPFFVWTRRNVPLQLRAIYENPAYITSMGHASQALEDNFTEGDAPFSPFAGSLAVAFGGIDPEDETWSRWMFDPDLPISNLEDLPLFANRAQGALTPFGNDAASLSAWASWTAQLLAPQYSMAGEAIYGDQYETNAPTGLNEILRVLNAVDFFNMIEDTSTAGDVKVSSTVAQGFNTAVPFLREWTSPFENNPNAQARYGFDNEEESLSDRMEAFFQAQVLGGLGASRQTPTDAKSGLFAASERIKEIGLRERERMPETSEGVSDDLLRRVLAGR